MGARNPDPGFWAGRRVLVTGHTGFKGGWLSLWLTHLGARVTGFALAPETEPSLCALTDLPARIDGRIGDVRDRAALAACVTEARPEIVLHLAAQALVRPSYADPVGTYASNVMGTVHLLEAVRACPSVRAVVIVTSDKAYENREWVWAYREDEPMGGRDPYSNSKGCAELVTGAYRASFFGAGRHPRADRQRPGRQRHRRRRLVARPPGPGRGARLRTRRAGGDPRARRGAALAARPGAALRLPGAGRGPVRGGRGSLRRRLELRPGRRGLPAGLRGRGRARPGLGGGGRSGGFPPAPTRTRRPS